MSNKLRLACDTEILVLPLPKILPLHKLDDSVRKTSKYKCIEASIRELGLIEPLVVFPQASSGGCYMLLDGHVRHMILRDLGEVSAKCLVATDDEGFTYNHKINRLSAIQEHFMIIRAIKNGVSEDRIARSLNVDVNTIRQKRDMLDGICTEVVQILKDRTVAGKTFRQLRRLKPIRQIEVAELICAADNYSEGYVKCLVGATPPNQLVDEERPKEVRGLSPEDVSRMEHEMATLGREFKLIEESHGKNVLNLVIVNGYLKKLLDNARIVRFLSQNHPEILTEFQKLVEARNLQDAMGN
ncbi:plasmid partitioning protein RepB C-terminal domain-containing protein [Planctomicrobium sp. SH661]|uniref:plasmid partitioning protein RepB C-terminal domain-containing protein n=1 Tax=Planctomicrobium sp. SH661 TaxID=3448124 RepID=UPI003F5BC23D